MYTYEGRKYGKFSTYMIRTRSLQSPSDDFELRGYLIL